VTRRRDGGDGEMEETERWRRRRDGGTAYLFQQFWEIRIASPYGSVKYFV
jgi:hypothetical protein